jgi:hypothetical protein
MVILGAMLFFAPGFGSALAATAAVESPPAEAAPSTIVADSVTQFFATELQRTALVRLEQAGRWRELDKRPSGWRPTSCPSPHARRAESVDPQS